MNDIARITICQADCCLLFSGRSYYGVSSERGVAKFLSYGMGVSESKILTNLKKPDTCAKIYLDVYSCAESQLRPLQTKSWRENVSQSRG